MNTCKTCKFWTDNPWGHPVPRGSCLSPKFLYGYNIALDKIAPDEVLVENDEGWGFVTGPDFGCVHHEEK